MGFFAFPTVPPPLPSTEPSFPNPRAVCFPSFLSFDFPSDEEGDDGIFRLGGISSDVSKDSRDEDYRFMMRVVDVVNRR